MERGLLGDAVEEVGEGLRCDDGGVAEVFEFLWNWLVLGAVPQFFLGRVERTALMVRIDRLIIAVCISSIGAILLNRVLGGRRRDLERS